MDDVDHVNMEKILISLFLQNRFIIAATVKGRLPSIARNFRNCYFIIFPTYGFAVDGRR